MVRTCGMRTEHFVHEVYLKRNKFYFKLRRWMLKVYTVERYNILN